MTSLSRRRPAAQPAAEVTIKDLLAYRLHRLANAISRSAALRYRRQFDVSLGEWRAIALLGANAPLSLNELARAAGLDKARMSRVIATLVERGLVLREVGGARGAVRLTLTRAGRALYRGLIGAAAERNDAFLDCLTAQERTVLERIMAKLSAQARALAEAEASRS